MILFVINGYFLDNAGFSKRCQKEIEMLSQNEKIVIMSRDQKDSHYTYHNKKVKIVSFTVKEELVETPTKYKAGWYEIYRNCKLFPPLITELFSQLWKYRKEKLMVYIVSSPLTVPFFCLFILKFFRIQNTVLEFHDLEPEMAMAIKNLHKTNVILKIEYFLEKFICKSYKKIIVTTNTQKKILLRRTGISEEKIFTLPNSIKLNPALLKKKSTSSLLSFNKGDFVVGYISSMTFAYTVTDVCNLLMGISQALHNEKHFKLLIIGDGDMLYKIKKIISQHNLGEQIIVTGKINNVEETLENIDVGIIPLAENEQTKSVIPTRLFEYFAAKKAVIAPNFPSFKEVILNYTNGLLYNSIDDLIRKIIELKENLPERNRLAQNGFEMFVNKYALNHYSQNYKKFLYERI